MDGTRFRRRTLGRTEVISGNDIVEEIPSYLTHTLAEGAICIIYDRNVTETADSIIKELKNSGYRVFVQAVSSARHKEGIQKAVIPDYVRHVLAVGAGTAAKYAKETAKGLDIEWSIYLTAPSTDTIMCGFAPNTVFIDEKVIINCPFECKASGYGILFSQPLNFFENFFSKKVLAKNTADNTAAYKSDMDVCELAYALLEISSNRVTDSAQLMSEVLYRKAVNAGMRPRLIGEYKFLASACVASFYSAFLGAPSIDAMPPACREVAADKLDSLGYVNKRPKNVDFFDANSYFRISYILSEYRMDLLEKLSSIDFHSSQRFWRRLYPDAGYWLKSEVTCRNLTDCLMLAGYLSDNLLGYAYASGIMSKF